MLTPSVAGSLIESSAASMSRVLRNPVIPVQEVCRPLPVGAASVHDVSGEWHVFRVRSQVEKKVAACLQASGIGFALPLRIAETCSHRKRRTCYLPVIPGTLCVAGGQVGRDAMLEYRKRHREQVFGDVPVLNRPMFLAQMDLLLHELDADPNLAVYMGFRPGAPCRVRGGEHKLKAFEGRPAHIEIVGERLLLNIRLSILGASFVVDEVTPDMIDLEPDA